MEITDPLKINTFTDLETWKAGHALVLTTYRLTKKFPHEEMYGLTSQMRRCAVSITSNIAEGFARQSYKEKVQFYLIAKGSLMELLNQLFIARDVSFLSPEDFHAAERQLHATNYLLIGLIRKSKTFF